MKVRFRKWSGRSVLFAAGVALAAAISASPAYGWYSTYNTWEWRPTWEPPDPLDGNWDTDGAWRPGSSAYPSNPNDYVLIGTNVVTGTPTIYYVPEVTANVNLDVDHPIGYLGLSGNLNVESTLSVFNRFLYYTSPPTNGIGATVSSIYSDHPAELTIKPGGTFNVSGMNVGDLTEDTISGYGILQLEAPGPGQTAPVLGELHNPGSGYALVIGNGIGSLGQFIVEDGDVTVLAARGESGSQAVDK